MKTTLFLLASLSACIASAQTFQYLDINQVKARVNSGGDLHWDPTNTLFNGYQCPVGNSKVSGGPASLWIGGLDNGGQLHLAAQTYHQAGVDYWPGPLTTNDATTNSTVVNQYNRVWKLNKSDIDAFILNFTNGNVQNGSYIPVADLLSWPGNGDISQNQDSQLAPYFDVNGDAYYNPMDGDYPLIKGDQAIYTIFNDNYLPHQSSGAQAIGIEIRLMAYAYGPCSIVANNSFLNYTTFYNYKIINRNSIVLYDVCIGLFNDSDIAPNDYVGCDVQDGYGYTYNNSSSNNPAVSAIQLKGQINTTDGVDNDGDGSIDEPGEQMGMTNFMYFNNSFAGVPVQTTDPSNASQYMQYMSGVWKDGTPLTCGGNGYGGAMPTSFAYPSNTDINGLCGSSNWTESGTGSDKRFVMGSNSSQWYPGMVTEIEYAYITSFDSITNNPLGKLDMDVQNLKAIYNSSINQCSVTGIKDQRLTIDFILSPNPANEVLNINLKTNSKVRIEVIDALGKVLFSEDYKEFRQTTINVGHLASGIYFVKLYSGENTLTKKFIKE